MRKKAVLATVFGLVLSLPAAQAGHYETCSGRPQCDWLKNYCKGDYRETTGLNGVNGICIVF